MGNIRKGLMTAVLFAGSVTGWAQKTPEALLGQLPAVPNVVCAADTSAVNAFISRPELLTAQLINMPAFCWIHLNTGSESLNNKSKR